MRAILVILNPWAQVVAHEVTSRRLDIHGNICNSMSYNQTDVIENNHTLYQIWLPGGSAVPLVKKSARAALMKAVRISVSDEFVMSN